MTTLANAGHDVLWTGDWERDPGDAEILAFAFRQGRVLVTLDKDFGELAIVHRQPHAGIVRLVNLRAHDQGLVALEVPSRYGQELVAGAIVTADSKRIRIRPTDM